jgi:DNA-binding LacI/PurR family transcriptional regulator
MKVTIKDVADLACVSTSTVSRVLHNNPKISNETKQRVEEAMSRLQYKPNVLARGLANKSTKTLGLLLPNDPEELFINPFFIKAMRGLSIYAQDHGYYLMYSFSKNEEEEVEFLRSYINSHWVEGIILFTSRQNDQCISYLKSQEFPFVVIGRPEDTTGVNWVDNDNFHAMYKVVNYLVQLGKKHIAFIGGPLTFNVTQNRLDGYRQALSSRGMDVDDALIVEANSFSEEAGYINMKRLLARFPLVDAVAATDDLLAFGALKAIKELDKPEEERKIAVVGFNNTLQSSVQSPTLTTVDINPDKLGYRAGKLIIDILEHEELTANHFIVDTILIERESTTL